MKKYLLLIGLIFTLLFPGGVLAQVGIGTTTPDKSAALDIISDSRGLLIPRIDLGNATDFTMMAEPPANSLLVYNTDADATGLPKGFYYWDDTAGQWVRIKDGASVLSANNGLHVDPVTGEVYLGGTLVDTTTIDVGGKALNISNLTQADAANKIVVAEDGTGELHTVNKTVSLTVTATKTIDTTNFPNYSPYTQQVYIEVDVANLSTADIDLTLPSATDAVGQEINIKLIDPSSTGDADNYLNIIDGTTTVAYGALPYQSWVLKSDGTNWNLVE